MGEWVKHSPEAETVKRRPDSTFSGLLLQAKYIKYPINTNGKTY